MVEDKDTSNVGEKIARLEKKIEELEKAVSGHDDKIQLIFSATNSF